MTLRQAEKLLIAVEAKAKTGEARLGRVKREQSRLMDEARRLEQESCLPFDPETDEFSGADMNLYGRNLARLHDAAARRRNASASLEPDRLAAESNLRRAVQEKLAWRKIAEEARAKKRKEFQDDQELKRDALVRSLLATKRKTTL